MIVQVSLHIFLGGMDKAQADFIAGQGGPSTEGKTCGVEQRI